MLHADQQTSFSEMSTMFSNKIEQTKLNPFKILMAHEIKKR